MSLYTLLNDTRFVGCRDARQHCACFVKQEGSLLSLLCRETEGEFRLILFNGTEEVPAQDFPLPSYVKERILFWNAWVADELMEEYIRPENPEYALVAYAISIAVDIAEAYPESDVDFCGFPVHDEWAVYQYSQAHFTWRKGWNTNYPLIPNEWKYNRSMQQLIRSQETVEVSVPPSGYILYHDVDYGCSDIHYDPASLPTTWGGYEDSLDIELVEGFPEWVVRKRALLELGWDETYEEVLPPESGYYSPSLYLRPFLLDALSIDVARHLPGAVPISSSPHYVTGEGVLEFIARWRRNS